MSSCWSKQHLLYFLSGMFFWEALCSLSLRFSGTLPVRYLGIDYTQEYNLYVMVGAAVVSALLLFLAHSSKQCACSSDSCKPKA